MSFTLGWCVGSRTFNFVSVPLRSLCSPPPLVYNLTCQKMQVVQICSFKKPASLVKSRKCSVREALFAKYHKKFTSLIVAMWCKLLYQWPLNPNQPEIGWEKAKSEAKIRVFMDKLTNDFKCGVKWCTLHTKARGGKKLTKDGWVIER